MSVSKLFISMLVGCLLVLAGPFSPLQTVAFESVAATEPSTQSASTHRAIEILNIGAFDKGFGVIQVAWNPNGQELAVAYDEDSTIRVLDTKTGRLKFTLQLPFIVESVHLLLWSPDGRWLACTLEHPTNAMYLWNLSSNVPKNPVVILDVGHYSNFSWSPDSKQLASVGDFGTYQDQWQAFIWDIATRTQVAHFESKDKPIVKVFWNPKGSTLATFTRNKEGLLSLQIRDVTTFQTRAEFPSRDDSLFVYGEVSWSADGSNLAGAQCDPISGACFLWIWDIQSNQLSQPFQKGNHLYDGNIGPFTSLVLNSKGNFLAVNDISGANYLWDVTRGTLISSLDAEPKSVTSLSWSPEGTLLAVGSTDGAVHIWKID